MNEQTVFVMDFQCETFFLQSLLKILNSSLGIGHHLELFSIQSEFNEKLYPVFTQKEIEAQAIILAASSLDVVSRICSFVTFIKCSKPDLPIMAVIDCRYPQMIVQLLKSGVDDFVTSPLKAIEIQPRLFRILGRYSEHRVGYELKEKIGLKQLVGKSAFFLAEVGKIPFLAQCDVSVLIGGETGTGKELCARAIHYLSPRSSGPFIPVNCGAIPGDLIENELFGHEQGAYTGASRSKPGLIEEAKGGTIFLDEIDCLSAMAQVKLLRFLQEGEYRPLGSTKTMRADVRVLAAMNSDFQQAVESGQIRKDLYYRLNVTSMVMPPLRQRREDIPLLASYFLEKYTRAFHKQIAGLTPETIELLHSYEWPGNIRELENIVERAVVFAESDKLEVKDIHLPCKPESAYESFRDAKSKMIAVFEKSYLERLLIACHGNVSKAAHEAKKNRRAFWQLVRKHHIDLKTFRGNYPE